MNAQPRRSRSDSHSRVTQSRVRAWTLVEVIGAMAILAILGAASVPLMIRETDRIARTLESKEMAAIATAVEHGIHRQHRIPDDAGWAEFVATELGRPIPEILTNSRGGRRLWIVDPRLRIGPGSGATLPYLQSDSGSREPVNPRVVLISSMGDPLPTTVRDGVAPSNARFDAIWSAASGVTPSGWGWSGRGEDLTIQRLHLGDQFIAAALIQAPTPPLGRFGVDATGTNAAPPGMFQTWYLRGTLVRLHAADATLQSSTILQSSMSVAYERGAWRGRPAFLPPGGHWSGAGVDDTADRFLAAPANSPDTGTAPRVTQSATLLSISNVFVAYRAWAQADFPRSGSLQASILDAANQVGMTTSNLILRP